MIAPVEAMCRRLQNTDGLGLPEIPGLHRKGSRVHQPPPQCLPSLHTHLLPCRTEAALALRAGFGCGREGIWHCLLPAPFCHSVGYLASSFILDSAGARQ